MDYLPFCPCPKCGSKETVKKNVVYEGDIPAEYSLYCKDCNTYLGFFCYGSWEY